MPTVYSSAVFSKVITPTDIASRYPTTQVYNDTSGVNGIEGDSAADNGYRTGNTIKASMILPARGPIRGFVIVCHGGGTGRDHTVMLDGRFGTYPGVLADRNGYVLISVDTGFRSLGNPYALTCVDFAYEYLLSRFGADFTRLGHQRVFLWGHSMGGLTAMQWAYRNPSRFMGMFIGSPSINVDLGITGPWNAWEPQSGDYDYGMGGGDNAGGFAAAYLVPYTGLPGSLAWSGPSDRDQTKWASYVTAQGFNVTTRNPTALAGLQARMYRSYGDNGGTFARHFVAAVNASIFTIREPFMSNPGTGHLITTWGTWAVGSQVVPSGYTDDQIYNLGGLAPSEFCQRFAEMEQPSVPVDPPDDSNVYYIPDAYANTNPGDPNNPTTPVPGDYVTDRLNTWLATVPDGSDVIVRGKAGASYVLGQSFDLIDRNLTLDGQGCEFYCPITDPLAPKFNRHQIKVVGGTVKLRNLSTRGTNTTPGHFVVEREQKSGIKSEGCASLLLDNVHVSNTWGDSFTFAHDTRDGGSVASRNVTILPNCSGTNAGRNGVAIVSCVDWDIAVGVIDGYGYLAFDIEPNGGNTRSVRGKWHGTIITPPPANPDNPADVELGTVNIGGGGQEITDLDIYDVHMTRRANTNRDVIEITAGTPTTNVRIGWLTDDGTDDGRGCTFRTIHAVVDVKSTPGFRFVGNDCYGTNVSGSLQDAAILTSNGGSVMPDAIAEYNTLHNFDKVVDDDSKLNGTRVRRNRFDDALPYDQPIP